MIINFHLDFALRIGRTPSLEWPSSTISNAHKESCYSQKTGIFIYSTTKLMSWVSYMNCFGS